MPHLVSGHCLSLSFILYINIFKALLKHPTGATQRSFPPIAKAHSGKCAGVHLFKRPRMQILTGEQEVNADCFVDDFELDLPPID